MNSIGGACGIGAPLSSNRVGGDKFIRHIGDRLILDFHEGAGETVQDLSGNGNDGTFKAAGEPAWERGSIHSDGSNDYITVALSASYTVTTHSISAYVNADTIVADGGICTSDNTSVTARIGLNCEAFAQSKWCGLTTFDGGGLAPGDCCFAQALGTDKWIHVSYSFDGTNQRVFENGALVTTTSQAGKAPSAMSSPLLIGNQWNGSKSFDGIISFVRVDVDYLSGPQVLQEYLWNKWRN